MVNGFTTFINEIGASIWDPLTALWYQVVDTVPGLVAAIIVAIVGFLVAKLIGYVVEEGLKRAGLDKKVREVGLSKALGDSSWAHILGTVLKWYVFLIFLTPAVSLVKLGALTTFLTALILWAPSVIAAVLIVMFGLIAAEVSYDKIAKPKKPMITVIAKITKVVIVFATVIIALNQIGIDISFAENTLLILVAGITLAIAIAIGVAFAYGLKPHAKEMCDKFAKY